MEKRFIFASLAFVVCSTVSMRLRLISEVLSGGGYGTLIPFFVFGAPFGLFYWISPLVAGGVFLKRRTTWVASCSIMLVHYVSAIAFLVIGDIENMFHRFRDEDRTNFLKAVVLYCVLNLVCIGGATAFRVRKKTQGEIHSDGSADRLSA